MATPNEDVTLKLDLSDLEARLEAETDEMLRRIAAIKPANVNDLLKPIDFTPAPLPAGFACTLSTQQVDSSSRLLSKFGLLDGSKSLALGDREREIVAQPPLPKLPKPGK